MPYDISIKNVALVGAGGNLGVAVIAELVKSGLFDITVLTRDPSTHTFPPSVKVVKVDYSSLESLATALTGQDALVSLLASAVVANPAIQKLLIDASIKAGVKRFIPSEFGCDLHNAKVRALPLFAGKVATEEYLDEQAQKGTISYTLIYTGPFLDWGLRNKLLLNFDDRRIDLYDGGEHQFSTSRLSTVGKAVRRVLTHPRETADRAIRVKDIDVSQKQLLKLAQALTPGEKWDVNEVDTAEKEKASYEQLEKKQIGSSTMAGFLVRAIFGKEYGGKFEHVHNSVLGIKGMTEIDLEELLASIFGRRKE